MESLKNITTQRLATELNMESISGQIQSLESFAILHKTQIDFAWTLCIYIPLFFKFGFMRHFISSKGAKVNNLPYIPLVVHIVVGLFIVARYQYRALNSTLPPQPETLDVVVGVLNAVISWRLCKYEARGNPRLVHVGFQVMSLMVLFPSIMCYLAPSPVWYRAMVKEHNAFIYVRWLLEYGNIFGIFSGYQETYTIGVWFGGILATWDARFPWGGLLGVPLNLALHVLLVLVERSITSRITVENSRTNPFFWLMLQVGLVEVEIHRKLKEAAKAPEESEKLVEAEN